MTCVPDPEPVAASRSGRSLCTAPGRLRRRTCRWSGSSCRPGSRSGLRPGAGRPLAGAGRQRARCSSAPSATGRSTPLVPRARRQAGGAHHRQGLNAPTAWRSATARCTWPRSAGSCATTISRRSLRNPPEAGGGHRPLPARGHHGWKYIAFGPDGWLYVPVGAPCNVCEPDPDRYALISRIKPDGSGYEVFARGVRNTVGFDWDPRTGSCGSTITAAT